MPEEKEELSPEQLKANRDKVINYYKNQIEVLEYQARHESLLADIESSRAKRMEMIIRQAQMKAGPESEKAEPEKRETPEKQVKAPTN
jgi:hypothetical protein